MLVRIFRRSVYSNHMLANPTNIQQTVAVRGSDISLDFIDASAKFMTFKAEYFFSKNADFWMSRIMLNRIRVSKIQPHLKSRIPSLVY
jgi:hypothetical protein